MSLFKDFQDYIELLCVSNVKTQHTVSDRKTFFRMDGEEDTAAINGKAASPMVVVTGFAGAPDGGRVLIASVLLFLSHVPATKINQANEIEKAQSEAFDLMMQFWKKIETDQEEGDRCAFMQAISNFSFKPVGPVNQYEFGWELTIRFNTEAPEHQLENWN